MNMKKCILTPKLFLNLATLYPSMQPYPFLAPAPAPASPAQPLDLGWELLPTFCECLPSASKDFRRMAVWELLIILLKKEGWLAAVSRLGIACWCGVPFCIPVSYTVRAVP